MILIPKLVFVFVLQLKHNVFVRDQLLFFILLYENVLDRCEVEYISSRNHQNRKMASMRFVFIQYWWIRNITKFNLVELVLLMIALFLVQNGNAQSLELTGKGKAKTDNEVFKSRVAVIRTKSYDQYVVAKVNYRNIPRVRRSDPALFGIFKRYKGTATFIGYSEDGVNYTYDLLWSKQKNYVRSVDRLKISYDQLNRPSMSVMGKHCAFNMPVKMKFQNRLIADIIRLEPGLEVRSVEYNGETDGTIRNNEKGTIYVKVENTGNIPLNNLYLKLGLKDAAGVTLQQQCSLEMISLSPGYEVTFSVPVSSNFDVPSGSVELSIVPHFGSFKGPLKSTTHAIPCQGFFEDDVVFSLPDSSSARVNAIKAYYGEGERRFELPSNTLPALIDKGDEKALLWQIVFRALGKGGYQHDMEWANAEVEKIRLDQIIEAARSGDLECIYLLSYALQLGLGTKKDTDFSINLLLTARNREYIPACCDWSVYLVLTDTNQEVGIEDLVFLRSKGLKKASYFLSSFDWAELDAGKLMSDEHVNLLADEAMNYGDCEAALVKAKLITNPKYGIPNYEAAKELLRPAIEMGYTAAMVEMGDLFYSSERDSVARMDSAFYYWSMGALRSDKVALFKIGTIYWLKESSENNLNLAYKCMKLSAEMNYLPAMSFLSSMHARLATDVNDVILARYWQNRVLEYKGDLERSKTAKTGEIGFLDILQNGDFSGRIYVYEDEYGRQYTEQSGLLDDLITGIVSGWAASARENSRQKQVIVDTAIKVKERFGKEYWAAMISSSFKTAIELGRGEFALFNVTGEVYTGKGATGMRLIDVFSGLVQESVADNCPHGAFIARLDNGGWYCNPSYLRNIDSTSALGIYLGVNDQGYVNNEGYYDCQIIVTRK